MADYDVENSGKLRLEDFNEIAKNMILDRDPQEDMKRAYKLFCEDSSGKISFRTLRKIAKYLSK